MVKLDQVPLGNLEVDWLLHTADIFFSRALRDQQQVSPDSFLLVVIILCVVIVS